MSFNGTTDNLSLSSVLDGTQQLMLDSKTDVPVLHFMAKSGISTDPVER
jgi:hypothetical protein